MHIHRLQSRLEYDDHLAKQTTVLNRRLSNLVTLEKEYKDKHFSLPGFSITAEKNVPFDVDWVYSDGEHINWRERLMCPITNLNNRQRASYHLYLSEMQPYSSDQVYLTEQVTPFYHFLKNKIENLVGSEYINSEHPGGYSNPQGVRHEDLTNLSFNNESLDKIISFDCLEHIPDYKKALTECYRALKQGGRMLLSFPFGKNLDETIVRAKILGDGTISHLTEPEYHGDPLSKEGCLSYYTFGWDILEVLRTTGFEDVYAILYWSDIFGYLGDEQIMFVAQK
ncbi:MAG: class I SAM-dependent methyltransferase [Arenicella sp.]|nr:class I SAM-dependent methyltransferase [Arenicella sp.]